MPLSIELAFIGSFPEDCHSDSYWQMVGQRSDETQNALNIGLDMEILNRPRHRNATIQRWMPIDWPKNAISLAPK
jgi:hypothetical protein